MWRRPQRLPPSLTGRGGPAVDATGRVLGDAAAYRADRAAELMGRLLLGRTLPVAEQDHGPVFLRQSADLLLDERVMSGLIETFVGIGRGGRIRDKPDPALFRLPPPRPIDACPGCNPSGNPVQPACDRIKLADRSTLLDQHQKSGLESVFRILKTAQDVAADPQHHGPMPRDQGLEGRFGTALGGPDTRSTRS